MSPEATVANVLYNFAQFVLAALNSGDTQNVHERAQECMDIALPFIVDDFRAA